LRDREFFRKLITVPRVSTLLIVHAQVLNNVNEEIHVNLEAQGITGNGVVRILVVEGS